MEQEPIDDPNQFEQDPIPAENTKEIILDSTAIRAELENLKIPSDKETKAKVNRIMELNQSNFRFRDLEETKQLAQELEVTKLEVLIDSLLKYRERNGRLIESAGRGDSIFAPGILVRDVNGELASVVDFQMVNDKTRYGREDPSIRRPKKLQNPIIRITYADGRQAEIDIDTSLTAVYNSGAARIQENEPFYDYSHIEVRGHEFRLGELVSFGDQIGTLAAIHPEEKIVEISARVIWGKDTARYLYQVGLDQIDYIERVDGDLKKNPDGTIYKPSLG